MMLSRKECDLLGGVTALLAFVLCDALFVARMAGHPGIQRGFGLFFFALVFPTLYLLVAAVQHRRQATYFLWLVLFLAFLVVEALLDFVLHVPFREVHWQVILYVVLFLGGLGGMVRVARRAGRRWGTVALVGFLSTLALAFAHFSEVGLWAETTGL